MPIVFPTTRWSLILGGGESPERRREVLGQIIGDYWQPLYVYARRRGLGREDAADALQDFVADVLERDFLDQLHPERGKLRSYLRVCFRHHLGHRHERAAAKRRGGGAHHVALDLETAEGLVSGAPQDPQEAYDRAWAAQLLGRCLERLIDEYEQGSRRGPASVLRSAFGVEAGLSYEAIAAEHDMSLTQVKSFVRRARLRYRELVLSEIADTVQGGPTITDELLTLMDLVR